MKVNNFYFAILIFLAASSCNLEEEVYSNFNPQGFFATEAEANLALNGNYNAIAEVYNGQSWFGLVNLPSDQLSQPLTDADQRELDEYSVSSSNQTVETAWRELYTVIARSNFIIDNLGENTSVPQNIRIRTMAESRFLRGLAYFNLIRLFGEVPLITTGNEVINSIQKSPVAEIYEQILTDLQIAESGLPLESEITLKGKASQGAAKSLLAKVYLHFGDFPNALAKAVEVITSQEYSLFPDYEELWLLQNENGREHIFSAQFNNGAVENGLDQFIASSTSEFRNGGFYVFLIDQDFFDGFPDTDYRKEVTFVEEGILEVFKFLDRTGESKGGAKNMNMPILRYADILLIAAEAENEVNGPENAYQYINQVRERARNRDGSPGTGPIDLSGLTKDEFRTAVYRERELELAFEGEAWFDLVRQGRFVEVLGPLGATESDMTLPLPQQDLDINDLL